MCTTALKLLDHTGPFCVKLHILHVHVCLFYSGFLTHTKNMVVRLSGDGKCPLGERVPEWSVYVSRVIDW